MGVARWVTKVRIVQSHRHMVLEHRGNRPGRDAPERLYLVDDHKAEGNQVKARAGLPLSLARKLSVNSIAPGLKSIIYRRNMAWFLLDALSCLLKLLP